MRRSQFDRDFTQGKALSDDSTETCSSHKSEIKCDIVETGSFTEES